MKSKSHINRLLTSFNKALILCLLFSLILAPQYSFANNAKEAIINAKKNKRKMSELLKEVREKKAKLAHFLDKNNIDSIEDYTAWVSKNLTYVTELNSDDWSDPLVTLARKSGDCEDLAFLHAAVLTILGYTPKVVAYSNKKITHAFCIFKKNGTFHVFDNLKYQKTSVKTMKSIALYLAKKYNSSYLFEVTLNPRKLNLLYLTKRKKK